MATIPNLNTLRTGRPGRRRTRGGRGGSNHPEDGFQDDAESVGKELDRIVQSTDFDASSSRMSAVSTGYLDDPYAEMLFNNNDQPIPKRYPIINRGTYVRTTAIDRIVNQFLTIHPDQPKQIVSLGAGSDTRFFRLASSSLHSNVIYHELDFESNINPKRSSIHQSATLTSLLRASERKGWKYHLHAIDLRNLTEKSPPPIPDLNPDVSTLLLSECCLCYMPPDTASSVIHYFSMNLKSSLALVLYEPIRPFDAFGRTMVGNLASRGIHLQTLKRFASLEAQRVRLGIAGFEGGQGARDVHQLWEDEGWVSREERERIERLEWLDEVEEWKLLASHYCVAWAWRGGDLGDVFGGFEGGRTSDEVD